MEKVEDIIATVSDGGEKCLFDVYVNPDLKVSTCDKKGKSLTFYGLLNLKMKAKEIFEMIEDSVFIKAHPIKVHESYDGKRDLSLKIEIMMMRYLSQLNRYNVTPCIPKYYADFMCNSFSGVVGGKFKESAKCLEGETVETATINQPFVYLMIEKIDGLALTDWLRRYDDYNYKDLENVIFQILYTTYQFHLAGIRHNDLHSDNVIVKALYPPRDLHFVIGQKIYTLKKCKWMPVIIDYDLSSFYNSKNLKNDPHDFCPKYGICGHLPNQKSDPVKILTNISMVVVTEDQDYRHTKMEYQKLLKTMSSDWFNMLVPPISIYKSGFDGQLCYGPVYKKNKKCDNYEPSDELFLTFPLMLERRIFTEVTVEEFTDDTLLNLSVDSWTSIDTPDYIYNKMNCLKKIIEEPV